MQIIRKLLGGSRKESQPQVIQPERSFARAATSENKDPYQGLLTTLAGQDPELVKKQLARQFENDPAIADLLLGRFVVNKYSKTDEAADSLRPNLESLFDNNSGRVFSLMGQIVEAREKRVQSQPVQ